MKNVLRTGLPNLKVEIVEQVEERDLVTRRKNITATHQGEIMVIAASDKML